MIRFAALAAAISLLLSFPLLAHDDHEHEHDAHDHACEGGGMIETGVSVTAGDLTFSNAFTRATMPNAPSAGGYLTIANAGDADERLVAASTPLAGEIQIHEMAVIDDVMRMQELAEGLVIPAGGSVSLAPGGLHLMFFRIDGQFVEGESVPVTLVFENAGEVEIDLAVGAVSAMSAGGHGH